MIVLTGATGFVGTQLVKRMTGKSKLLLVSRNVAEAKRLFPDASVCDYATLPNHDLTGSVFIHLAARNNDQAGTFDEFEAANIKCLSDVAAIAKAGGASKFINLCSTHALNAKSDDFYGVSKQTGARALSKTWPEAGINLYVPAIYGDSFRGRLAALTRFPRAVRPVVLALMRQVKPMISIDYLEVVLSNIVTRSAVSDDPWKNEQYAADPIRRFGIFSAVKRGIDLATVLGTIVFLGWLMALIACYVRLNSRGPAIFRQRRIGQGGEIFICYKFRTMTEGTAHAATHEISAAAVTSAGRILRRTKLDELPQIANILMNQMSLVGPRPCLPVQNELIARRRARGVLSLKPGITGLAQIQNVDMSDPARLAALDDRYRAFRTLFGDVQIVVRTMLGSGAGDRVGR